MSADYGNIKVDPNYGKFEITELMFSVDKLTINDDPMGGDFRSLNYTQLESWRKIQDAKTIYSFAEGTPVRRIYKLYNMCLDSKGTFYRREVKLVVD